MKDSSKFSNIELAPGKELNLLVNLEKKVSVLLKSLFDQEIIDEFTYKYIKPVGSRPGILYGLGKVHKEPKNGLPPFRPILSAIGTPTYKLAKFLLQFLTCLSNNDYTLKDSFSFANEICQQNSDLYMASLDVDSLFTNIPLDETITLSVESLYSDTSPTVTNICKDDFYNLLNIATKESFFVFNDKFYKQIDGVAMGSPLGPVLANIFMCNFEKKIAFRMSS